MSVKKKKELSGMKNYRGIVEYFLDATKTIKYCSRSKIGRSNVLKAVIAEEHRQ